MTDTHDTDTPAPLVAEIPEAIPEAAIEIGAIGLFHALRQFIGRERQEWGDVDDFFRDHYRNGVRGALYAALPLLRPYSAPTPSPVPVVTQEMVDVAMASYDNPPPMGVYGQSIDEFYRYKMGYALATVLAAAPPPPPAPGLDEFVRWSEARDGVVSDDYWTNITMAEAVAQFRASRATTEGSGDDDQ